MHHTDIKSNAVLNQLLRVNNERSRGYARASMQTDVSILQVLFERLSITSQQCCEELSAEIYKLGGVPTAEKQKGQFGLVWKSITEALVENNHKSLLESCYIEEFMTYKSYEYAMRYFGESVTNQQAQLISRQHELLKEDHCKVKNLRNVLLDAA